MYFVYLLRCNDGTLYAGITIDVARRLREHKAGIGGRYTRAHGAVRMVHIERRRTRSSALKREAELKRWGREKKLALVSNS